MAAFISAKRQGYRFIRRSAEEAEFEEGQFQLIVCDNVLDHAQRPLTILKKCYEWLSPLGFLVIGINTFSAVGLVKWRIISRFRGSDSNFVMHPHSGTHRMWRNAIRRAGLSIGAERGPRFPKSIAGHAMRSYFACQKDA